MYWEFIQHTHTHKWTQFKPTHTRFVKYINDYEGSHIERNE